MKFKDEEALLSTDEAAEWLGLAPSTLATWRTRKPLHGLLPFIYVGGQARYRKEDLIRYLDARRIDPNREDPTPPPGVA